MAIFTFHSCPGQDHSHRRPNLVSKTVALPGWIGAHYVEDEAFTVLLGAHGALTPSQPDSSLPGELHFVWGLAGINIQIRIYLHGRDLEAQGLEKKARGGGYM